MARRRMAVRPRTNRHIFKAPPGTTRSFGCTECGCCFHKVIDMANKIEECHECGARRKYY